MNNLNSILLEGELVGDTHYQNDESGKPSCRFTLSSSRFFKIDGGIEKETCNFDIETKGKLAVQCRQDGHQGRGLRVVGRLKQEYFRNKEGKQLARIVIVAEHSDLWSVEFRPAMVQERKQILSRDEDFGMGR